MHCAPLTGRAQEKLVSRVSVCHYRLSPKGREGRDLLEGGGLLSAWNSIMGCMMMPLYFLILEKKNRAQFMKFFGVITTSASFEWILSYRRSRNSTFFFIDRTFQYLILFLSTCVNNNNIECRIKNLFDVIRCSDSPESI